ncbi:MAG: TMEM165/GDT1 family protein [Clostridia bacterium]
MPIDWRMFLSTFVVIFVAEFGDKTQVAAMMMSAESKNAGSVFFGAASALVLSSLLAVTFGAALARVVPSEFIRLAAGSVFIFLGILVILGR